MKFVKIVATSVFAVVFATFLAAPQKYMQSFLNGATVWALNVLPSLFPFAVLSPLALKFVPQTKRSVTKSLFGIAADEAFLTSLLCGYPLGAKQLSEYDFGKETTTAACSFCSSASPIFVVATVGAKLLKSNDAAVVLLVSHVVGVVLNGLLHRKSDNNRHTPLPRKFSASDVGNAVSSAVGSVLSVGGLIALFYMLTDMLKSFLPQNVANSAATSFLIGLVEMTNGIVGVCTACNTLTATVLCSFLLSFGGLCVLLQSLAFLSDKINAAKFLIMKLTQAGISALVCFGLCLLLPLK